MTARQSKEHSTEAERAADAVNILTEIMNIPENSIPEKLMARAHGIAVIPHVVKGAFGVGGQWGKGLMSQRREDGSWSAPAYVEIGGGSFGLQIGVEASDIVLVFTDEDGIRGILKGKVKLGADTFPSLLGQLGGTPKSAPMSFSDLPCLHTHGAKDCSREFHWMVR